MAHRRYANAGKAVQDPLRPRLSPLVSLVIEDEEDGIVRVRELAEIKKATKAPSVEVGIFAANDIKAV